MIIQSRKHPEKTWDISLDDWNNLKKSGNHRKYRILSSDIGPDSVATPVEVQNFMNSKEEAAKVEKIYEDEEKVDLDSMKKEELIEKYPDLELDMTMKKDDIIEKIKSQE